MGFYLDHYEIDLGETPIENIFINEFMPDANGTYVKVYLLGLLYANKREFTEELTNESLANDLKIPLSDCLEAWNYWEKQGIIEKIHNGDDPHNYSVKFLNLKELYFTETSKRDRETRKTLDTDQVLEMQSNKRVHSMIQFVKETLGRAIYHNEITEILNWMYEFNVTPEMIERAFETAVAQGRRKSISYVRGILSNWHDLGVNTPESLENLLKTESKKEHSYQTIFKSFGMKGNLHEVHRKIIDKWLDDWKFPVETVLYAGEIANVNTQEPNFKYIDTVLGNWKNEGLYTKEDIEKSQKTFEKSKTQRRKTQTHNFKEREETQSKDDMEEIAANIRKRYFENIGE